MNDMNETLAEIRRRGNDRIRARKQMRSRVAAFCVPLVLCVAAFFALPDIGMPTNISRPVETMIPTATQPMQIPSYQVPQTLPHGEMVVLTVAGKGVSRSYTDREILVKLQNMLDAIVTSGHTVAEVTDVTAAGSPATAPEKSDSFWLHVGGEMEFWLHETSVYFPEENIAYSISAAQYQALRMLLELE